ETSSPASMMAFALRPTSVCAATAARSMSPVESCRIPRCSIRRAACVPLPAPGGPRRMMFIALTPFALELRLLDQVAILVREKVELDLANRVDGNIDHDQQPRAAQYQRKAGPGDHVLGHPAHHCQVARTYHCNAGENVVEMIGGALAG